MGGAVSWWRAGIQWRLRRASFLSLVLALLASGLLWWLGPTAPALGSVADDSTATAWEPTSADIDPDVVWESNGTGVAVSAAIVDESGAVLTGQVLRIDDWPSPWDVPKIEAVFCRVTYLWDGEGLDGPPMIDSVVDLDGAPTFSFPEPSVVLEKGVPASVWSLGVRLGPEDRGTGATCVPAGTYVDGAGGGAVPTASPVSVAGQDREMQIVQTSDPVDLAAVGVGETITYTVSYTNTGNEAIWFAPSYFFSAPGGNPDALRVDRWAQFRLGGWEDRNEPRIAWWWADPSFNIAEPGSTQSYSFTYVVREADLAGSSTAGAAMISSYPGAIFEFDGGDRIEVYCGPRPSSPSMLIDHEEPPFHGLVSCNDVAFCNPRPSVTASGVNDREGLAGIVVCNDGTHAIGHYGDQQIDHQPVVGSGDGESVARSGCVSTTTIPQVTVPTLQTGSPSHADTALPVACGPCTTATLTFSGCWDETNNRSAASVVNTTTTTSSYLAGSTRITAATTQSGATTVPVVAGYFLPITGGSSRFLVGFAVLNMGVGLILVSVGAVHLGRKHGYFDF